MYLLYDTCFLLQVRFRIRRSPDQCSLQLPEAFRRSTRPSSASIAKASTMRPY